jgi:hypothetical protein
MNTRQKKAMKESAITVFSGMLVNWPISIIFLYVFIDILKLEILETSFLMTAGFTIVALIRVYIIRMIIEKRNERVIPSPDMGTGKFDKQRVVYFDGDNT